MVQRLPLDRVETLCLEPDWREVRDESSANPDESYYNNGFGWLDLYDYNIEIIRLRLPHKL